MANLEKLKKLDSVVQWYQGFTTRGHMCLVFEQLDKSLYDFLQERHFLPLCVKSIRPIVQQVGFSLLLCIIKHFELMLTKYF